MDTTDLAYNADLDTNKDYLYYLEYFQTEKSSHLVADDCLGMDMEYTHAQTEQSNLVA